MYTCWTLSASFEQLCVYCGAVLPCWAGTLQCSPSRRIPCRTIYINLIIHKLSYTAYGRLSGVTQNRSIITLPLPYGTVCIVLCGSGSFIKVWTTCGQDIQAPHASWEVVHSIKPGYHITNYCIVFIGSMAATANTAHPVGSWHAMIWYGTRAWYDSMCHVWFAIRCLGIQIMPSHSNLSVQTRHNTKCIFG